MDLKNLRLDTSKSDDGVWVDYEAGIQFKIARLGNAAYRKKMRELGKPHRIHLRRGSIDDEVIEDMSTIAISETILLDWRNVTKDGEPWPYSPEVGRQVLDDPAYRDIFEFILEVAQEQERFRTDHVEDNEGN